VFPKPRPVARRRLQRLCHLGTSRVLTVIHLAELSSFSAPKAADALSRRRFSANSASLESDSAKRYRFRIARLQIRWRRQGGARAFPATGCPRRSSAFWGVPEAVPWGWRHMFARHMRLDQRLNYGISEEKQDNRARRETPECTLDHSRVPVSIEPDRLIAQSCTLATAGDTRPRRPKRAAIGATGQSCSEAACPMIVFTPISAGRKSFARSR
jgi:hypothetical protein